MTKRDQVGQARFTRRQVRALTADGAVAGGAPLSCPRPGGGGTELMMMDLDVAHASSPPEVDPGVVRLLAECTHDLRPRHTELVMTFHQRLLELVPAVADLPGSGRPVAQRTVTAVLHPPEPGRFPGAAPAVVHGIGAENYREGFLCEQYGSVTHALLHAVRAVYPGEWSSALSSAWVEHLLRVRAELLVGAQDQQAQDRRPAGPAGPAGSGAAVEDVFPPDRSG